MADPFKLVDRLEEIDVLTETQKELLGDRAMDGEDITPVLRAWTRVGGAITHRQFDRFVNKYLGLPQPEQQQPRPQPPQVQDAQAGSASIPLHVGSESDFGGGGDGAGGGGEGWSDSAGGDDGKFEVTDDWVMKNTGGKCLCSLRSWVVADETKRMVTLSDAHAIPLEEYPGFKVHWFVQSTPALMDLKVQGQASLANIATPRLPKGVTWPTTRKHYTRRNKVAIALGPAGKIMVVTSTIDDLRNPVDGCGGTLPGGFTGENWAEMARLTLKYHFGQRKVLQTWSDLHRIDGATTPWGKRAALIAKGRKRKAAPATESSGDIRDVAATAEPGDLQRDAVIWSAGIHGFCSKKQWTSSPWETALRGGNGIYATLVFPTVEQFKNPTPMDLPPAACNLEDKDVDTAVKSYNLGFRLMEKDGKMHRATDSTIWTTMRADGIHTKYAESLENSIGRSRRHAKSTSRVNSMSIKYKNCDTVSEDDVTAAMYLSVLLEKLGRLGEVTKGDCARDGGGRGNRKKAAAASVSDTPTGKGKGRRVSGSGGGEEEEEAYGAGSSFEFPGSDGEYGDAAKDDCARDGGGNEEKVESPGSGGESGDAGRASMGVGSCSGAGSGSDGETNKETQEPTGIALELFTGQRPTGRGPQRNDDPPQMGSVDNVENN